MRLSRTSLQTAVAGVALGLVSGAASASAIYELRLSTSNTPGAPASTNNYVVAPGVYSLDLWERVSGTNGSHPDEKLANSYVNIRSSGPAGSGGLTVGATVSPFNDASARNGAGGDLNGDGIGDWGSTSTNLTNTAYMFARTANAGTGGEVAGGTLGNAVGADGWEFKIATFTVNVTGDMTFNISKPVATLSGASAGTYTQFVNDGTTVNVQNSNAAAQGTFANSVGAHFVVPEPASIGLIGAAAIGLLGRRRRN
jgi:hypothetical protein